MLACLSLLQKHRMPILSDAVKGDSKPDVHASDIAEWQERHCSTAVVLELLLADHHHTAVADASKRHSYCAFQIQHNTSLDRSCYFSYKHTRYCTAGTMFIIKSCWHSCLAGLTITLERPGGQSTGQNIRNSVLFSAFFRLDRGLLAHPQGLTSLFCYRPPPLFCPPPSGVLSLSCFRDCAVQQRKMTTSECNAPTSSLQA